MSDDLRSELESAYDAPTETTETPAVVVSDSTAVPADTTGTASTAASRARDESGRFAKQAAPAEPALTPATGEQPAPELNKVETVETKPAEPPKVAKVPPGSWSAQAKADFAALAPHIQDEILKRESDFSRGVNKNRETAEFGERLRQVIAPYEATIRAEGGTPELAVRDLLNTAYQLRTVSPLQKAALLMQVGQQYGADFNTYFQTQQQGGVSPEIAQLMEENHQLKQKFQAWEQSQQQAGQQALSHAVSAFMSETDESGQPKNLYVENVMDEMVALIPVIRQAEPGLSQRDTLQKAYDRAIWARPDIRQTLVQQQTAEAEKKRKEAEAQAVQRAKQAAVSVTGAPNGASLPVPKDSVRSELLAAWGS